MPSAYPLLPTYRLLIEVPEPRSFPTYHIRSTTYYYYVMLLTSPTGGAKLRFMTESESRDVEALGTIFG